MLCRQRRLWIVRRTSPSLPMTFADTGERAHVWLARALESWGTRDGACQFEKPWNVNTVPGAIGAVAG